MADNGDDTGEDTGGFVFGDERATDDGDAVAGSALNLVNIIAVALLVVAVVGAIVVVVAALIQPFGMDAAPGQRSGSSGASAGTTATAGVASDVTSTETGTVDRPTNSTTTASRQAGATPTPSSPTATQTTQPPATPTPTPTRTATPTATQTAPGGSEGGGGDGTENATATPGERSPVIEAFSVTDRSRNGTAIFDVAWNVSDSNRDLVSVRVSLVADPDGEARIIEQRRFDAGGARSTGSTTFAVDGGAGEVYAVRIQVLDGSGNTAFQLTRVVADGSPDG